nr:type IV secretion system DNA-binding domain-containing protein [uncultured Pseudogulbenkiania sp.]
MSKKINNEEFILKNDYLNIGNLFLSNERLNSGVFVVGMQGSGKTVLLNHFLKKILLSDDKLIMGDVKLEYTSYIFDQRQVAINEYFFKKFGLTIKEGLDDFEDETKLYKKDEEFKELFKEFHSKALELSNYLNYFVDVEFSISIGVDEKLKRQTQKIREKNITIDKEQYALYKQIIVLRKRLQPYLEERDALFEDFSSEELNKLHDSLPKEEQAEFTANLGLYKLYEPVIISPFDTRTYSWDVARDLSNEEEIKQFFRSSKGENDSKSKFFDDASVAVLTGLFIESLRSKGRSYELIDPVNKFIGIQSSQNPEEKIIELIKTHKPEALSFVNGGENMVGSVIATVSTEIENLKLIANSFKGKQKFSFKEFILDDNSVKRKVILHGHPAYQHISQNFVGRIINYCSLLVSSTALKASKSRKLWFFFDESPQFGRINVEPLLAVGRSKGARLIKANQTIEQDFTTYGEKETDSLLAMFRTKFILQTAAGKSAEKICDMIGKQEITGTLTSKSYSQNGGNGSSIQTFHSNNEKVLHESQLEELGVVDGGVELYVLGFGNKVFKMVVPFPSFKPIRESFKPQNWLLPDWTQQEIAKQEEELKQREELDKAELAKLDQEQHQEEQELTTEEVQELEELKQKQPVDIKQFLNAVEFDDNPADVLEGLAHGMIDGASHTAGALSHALDIAEALQSNDKSQNINLGRVRENDSY